MESAVKLKPHKLIPNLWRRRIHFKIFKIIVAVLNQDAVGLPSSFWVAFIYPDFSWLSDLRRDNFDTTSANRLPAISLEPKYIYESILFGSILAARWRGFTDRPWPSHRGQVIFSWLQWMDTVWLLFWYSIVWLWTE